MTADAVVPVASNAGVAIPRRAGFWRRWWRKPLGVVSAGFLLLITLACVAAPWLAPYTARKQDLQHVRELPSAAHLLGTDTLGRDILSRLLFGGQITLLGVLEAVLVLLLIGVPIGLVAGYQGGWFDRLMGFIIDLILAMPTIIIVLAVLAVFGTNMAAAMITLGVLGSAGLIRIVRSVVLAVREELYVAAARVFGATAPQILWRHILPRIAGPVIVQATLFAGIALAVQTGLAFLSLGIVPPAPSWGGMVGDAAKVIEQFPWLLVPSGGIIGLTILAFGLLGDSVRDATVEGWSRRSGADSHGNWIQAAARRRGARWSPVPARDSSEAILRVDGLSVAFGNSGGDTTVVQDVSFEVAPGEVLGLVGESGCGKTVTALTLLSLLPPNGKVTAGHVWLHGQDLTTLAEGEMEHVRGSQIAMVFQEPMVSLDPSFRVGAQVAEVVRRHTGMSRGQAKRRAIELFAQVRLPEPAQVARRYPHELSGGMAQRVCLALALAGNPRLLIADEPTTALDVTVQAEILDLLRTIQSETGMAIILVTHDWGVVAELCDRAIVMYAGQVVEHGPVRSLIREPRHPYTRGLLESDPQRSIGAAELPTIRGSVPPPSQWPAGCHFQDRCPLATVECNVPIPLLPDGPDRSVRCIKWTALADTRVGAS
jgi:peptide/nickel transport system permease protein